MKDLDLMTVVAIAAIVLGYFIIGAYFDPFSDSVADWLDAKGW